MIEMRASLGDEPTHQNWPTDCPSKSKPAATNQSRCCGNADTWHARKTHLDRRRQNAFRSPNSDSTCCEQVKRSSRVARPMGGQIGPPAREPRDAPGRLVGEPPVASTHPADDTRPRWSERRIGPSPSVLDDESTRCRIRGGQHATFRAASPGATSRPLALGRQLTPAPVDPPARTICRAGFCHQRKTAPKDAITVWL